MQADIIAIGTELTSGAKLDTNSQWLSRELADLGIRTICHTTVADDLEEMLSVLGAAMQRSDLVLITGGLGPTRDDLTRDLLAQALRVPLILHEASLEHIRALFAGRGRTMPERNLVQAQFPEGTRPLPNPRGTAPGIWAEVSRGTDRPPCRIAALPGVPSEMKPMFREHVVPRLPRSGTIIRRARIHCFGLGESAVEEMLGELTARGRQPEVGITAHEATITLRIIAHGTSSDECEAQIEQARREIQRCMGDFVFGEEDDELEDVVVRLLKQAGKTMASAETGTGGLLAHRVTDVPGYQKCYLGSLILPNATALCAALDLDPDEVARAGTVSEATGRSMAVACREKFSADFALSITEVPALTGAGCSEAAPVTWIALAGPDSVQTCRHVLVGDWSIAKSRAVKQALNMLRLKLLAAAEG